MIIRATKCSNITEILGRHASRLNAGRLFLAKEEGNSNINEVTETFHTCGNDKLMQYYSDMFTEEYYKTAIIELEITDLIIDCDSDLFGSKTIKTENPEQNQIVDDAYLGINEITEDGIIYTESSIIITVTPDICSSLKVLDTFKRLERCHEKLLAMYQVLRESSENMFERFSIRIKNLVIDVTMYYYQHHYIPQIEIIVDSSTSTPVMENINGAWIHEQYIEKLNIENELVKRTIDSIRHITNALTNHNVRKFNHTNQYLKLIKEIGLRSRITLKVDIFLYETSYGTKYLVSNVIDQGENKIEEAKSF